MSRWGFPGLLIAQSANLTDDAGLLEMLTLNIDYFKSKPVNIAKITILLDHGYHPTSLIEELEKVYPQIMTKIRFERSTKPSKQEKATQGKSGFVPAVARWVIERSNAWIERCKSLTKNSEANPIPCNHQNQSLLRQANAEEVGSLFLRSQMGSINANILKPSVLPDNEAQRAWILSRQRFWSARGLMLAFRLFGVIPDPTQRGGIIYEDFRPEDIAELKLLTDIDYAIYQLLVVGDTLIRNFVASEGQDYPFDSPLDLFIEILRTTIHRGLTEESPWNPEPAWRIPVIPEFPHKKTKDPGPEKIIRNMYRRFIKFLQGGFDGEPEEKTVVHQIIVG